MVLVVKFFFLLLFWLAAYSPISGGFFRLSYGQQK